MRVLLLSLMITLLAAGPAWAHGGQPHAPARAVVREQTDWGLAGEAVQVTRTVTLTMTDAMRFTPDRLDVRLGETVRLRVRNSGRLPHELVIGTREALAAHAELMRKHPHMEHDEPYMAHVAPGRRGEIVWTFNRAGEFEFACLAAGHFQAGMKGTIRVLAHETGATPEHAAAAGRPQVEALVRTVDKSARKITLRHGDIPNLDMGAMTMVFHVRDPALLERVRPGDTVRFTADLVRGAYTVLTLEPVPR